MKGKVAMIDQRTGLEIIEEAECWDLVDGHGVGRVVVSIANKPDIFPVNYKLDDRAIYIHTVPGTKLAGAVLGRAVAFEVDDLDETSRQGWSVVIHGVAREVEKLEEIMHAETLGITPWTTTPKFRFLRIEADEISGRRIPAD